jgi:hypothetical protein
MQKKPSPGLSTPLLLGFAISATGGPLALALLYLVQSARVPAPLLPDVAALGGLSFLAPLLVWYGYSGQVASSGGLYAFVRCAAGLRIARIQGAVWTISYLLYLPYTVTYIVFYLLTAILPVSRISLEAIQIGLPILLSGLVVADRKLPFVALGVSAALQLGALAAIGLLVLPRTGVRPIALPAPTDVLPVLSGAGNVSALFLCLSLVLFLGGEARGGPTALRWVLVGAFSIVALFVLFSAVLLASSATPRVLSGEIPGFDLVARYSASTVAILVALLILVSVAGLIVAEFVALIRLWHAMLGIGHQAAALGIAGFFVLSDALSLISPYRLYQDMLLPSLAALFLSQIIVFAAYPWFVARRRQLRFLDGFVAVVASLLMVYGLYGLFTSPPTTP